MRTACLVAVLLGSILSAQDSATKIKKVNATPVSAASGQKMFNEYCGSCHGTDGKGNGPAASALKAPPADLTMLTQKNGKFPAAHVEGIIKEVNEPAHGSKEMPVWGPILSSVSGNDPAVVTLRAHNIAKYIESLQGK